MSNLLCFFVSQKYVGNCLKPHRLYLRRRQWQPTPVLLPGKSYGWRSLVGCSPWGCWESDTASLSLFIFMNWRRKWQPTPGSCLENPRDGGVWWAAVYGVAQSRTQLKRLSSSSRLSFSVAFYVSQTELKTELFQSHQKYIGCLEHIISFFFF